MIFHFLWTNKQYTLTYVNTTRTTMPPTTTRVTMLPTTNEKIFYKTKILTKIFKYFLHSCLNKIEKKSIKQYSVETSTYQFQFSTMIMVPKKKLLFFFSCCYCRCSKALGWQIKWIMVPRWWDNSTQEPATTKWTTKTTFNFSIFRTQKKKINK